MVREGGRGVITTGMVYETFRRFLARQIRIYDEDSIHVGEACNCLRKSYYTRKHGSKDLSHLAPSKRVILGTVDAYYTYKSRNQ